MHQSPTTFTYRTLFPSFALFLYPSPSTCTYRPLLVPIAIYLYSSFFLSIRLRPLDVPIPIYLYPRLLVPIALFFLYLSPSSSCTHLPLNAPIAHYFYLSYFTSILRPPNVTISALQHSEQKGGSAHSVKIIEIFI